MNTPKRDEAERQAEELVLSWKVDDCGPYLIGCVRAALDAARREGQERAAAYLRMRASEILEQSLPVSAVNELRDAANAVALPDPLHLPRQQQTSHD